jgi:hypothetical protein
LLAGDTRFDDACDLVPGDADSGEENSSMDSPGDENLLFMETGDFNGELLGESSTGTSTASGDGNLLARDIGDFNGEIVGVSSRGYFTALVGLFIIVGDSPMATLTALEGVFIKELAPGIAAGLIEREEPCETRLDGDFFVGVPTNLTSTFAGPMASASYIAEEFKGASDLEAEKLRSRREKKDFFGGLPCRGGVALLAVDRTEVTGERDGGSCSRKLPGCAVCGGDRGDCVFDSAACFSFARRYSRMNAAITPIAKVPAPIPITTSTHGARLPSTATRGRDEAWGLGDAASLSDTAPKINLAVFRSDGDTPRASASASDADSFELSDPELDAASSELATASALLRVPLRADTRTSNSMVREASN